VSRGDVALAFLLALLVVIQSLGGAPAQGSPPVNQPQQLYGFTQYSIPQNSTQPGAITVDGNGNLWFVEQGLNAIGSFDPSSGAFSSYPIPTPSALPQGIAVDPQGNVWFAELGPNKLGELGPGESAVVEVAIPPGPDGLGCGPIGVTPHGGSVWITCEFSNQIDEYTPSGGSFKEFDLPLIFSAPLQIAFDKAGNFWFTASDVGMLGYAVVAQLEQGTASGITEFAPINSTYVTTISNSLLPGGGVRTSLSLPSQIAISPDGNSLWVTEHGGSSFDHYEIGTKSLVKYFTTASSTPSYPDSLPNGIALDSNGNVWVTEHGANRVAEFVPASGSMIEYAVPCCGKGLAGVLYLTLGRNGTVWFTEFFGNAIGELSSKVGAPPAATLSPGSVSMGASSTANVSVSVSLKAGGPGASQEFTFRASGVTQSGAPQNLTAHFSPSALTVGPGSNATAVLSLSAAGLRPGVYYLTVGAMSTSTGVISSRFLVLTVTQGNQDLLLWAGLAAIVLIAVGAIFARRGRRRTRKRPASSRTASAPG
jgi:virginiamycin B lyase